jgi:hypothetical protein
LPLEPAIDELRAAMQAGRPCSFAELASARPCRPRGVGLEGLIEDAIDEAAKEPGEDWSVRCKENLASAHTGFLRVLLLAHARGFFADRAKVITGRPILRKGSIPKNRQPAVPRLELTDMSLEVDRFELVRD